MSLIHWWPLNGNLNDYGVKNQKLDNSNVTFVSGGKIGQAALFDSDSDKLSCTGGVAELHALTKYSMCCWIYLTAQATNHSSSFLSSGNWNTGSAQICFGLYNWNSGYGTLLVPNGSYWGGGITLSNKIQLNVWHHFAIVYDGSTTKGYVDGIYVGSYNGGGISTTENASYYLGAATYYTGFTMKGRMNDFRIYDHALSVKEVKEISKGLVLHYDFEDEYAEGTTNLRPWSSTITSTTISGWDASKNDGATAYTRSGWGYGYNGGVPSPGVGYHAHWVYLDGELVMKFPNLNSEVSQKGRWLGISASLTIPWTAGKKYTISWEQRTDNLNLKPFGGIYYKLTSSGSNNFHDGNVTLGSNTKTNTWERVSRTFTVNSNYDGSVTSASIYVYGYSSSQEGTIYVRNVQVEYKDHATPFVASSRSNGLIYDNSGYGYNGTQYGNALQIVGDSACGEHSAKFNNTINSAIVCGNGMLVKDEITVNWWGYMSNWANYGRALSCTEGGGWNFEPNSSKMAFPLYLSGIGYKSAVSTTTLANLSAGWHMFTGAYDGYTNKIYIDGVLEGSISSGASSKTAIAYAANGLFIGAEAAGNTTTPTSPYFNGNIADVKIYATALSASDILAEYQRKAAIDRNGNLYSGQFIEQNGTTKIATKKDQVITDNFVEGTDKVKVFDKYIELEYIESTGTQWTDSGVSITSKTNVECKIQWTNISGSYPMLYGAWGIFSLSSMPSQKLCISSGGYSGNNPWSSGPTISANVLYEITHLPNKLTINDTEYTIPNASSSNSANVRHILLFAASNSGDTPYNWSTYCKCKMYDFKIYDDDEIVRHFIPAKRKSDNVIGLFDLINQKFYTNAGTGTFTAGPEKGELSIVCTNELNEL